MQKYRGFLEDMRERIELISSSDDVRKMQKFHDSCDSGYRGTVVNRKIIAKEGWCDSARRSEKWRSSETL